MRFGFLVTLIVLSLNGFTQNFEGLIKWKITATELNQKELPAVQNEEALKKLEEQMKDPEFKKQMEQNPQLKAMMEQNIAQLKNTPNQGNESNKKSFLPHSIIIKIKDNNSLVKMEGGISDLIGDFLYRNDKDVTYSVKRKNKTYAVIPKSQDKNKSNAKITRTDATTKIMGYTCRKYIVETEEEGKKNIQHIWTSTEVKSFNADIMKKMEFGKNFSEIYYDGLEGIPLKVETHMPEMKMTLEIIEIKPQALDASDFIIPSDYKLSKF